MLVGEQPGDREEVEASRSSAGRQDPRRGARRTPESTARRVFVTNVVKHFKWRPAPGKRRLHETPEPGRDRRVPALGRGRARARPARGRRAARRDRGEGAARRRRARHTRPRPPIESELAPLVMATIHPSAVLRARGRRRARRSMAGLVADLSGPPIPHGGRADPPLRQNGGVTSSTMPAPILLVGMMGSGKSTVGRALAGGRAGRCSTTTRSSGRSGARPGRIDAADGEVALHAPRAPPSGRRSPGSGAAITAAGTVVDAPRLGRPRAGRVVWLEPARDAHRADRLRRRATTDGGRGWLTPPLTPGRRSGGGRGPGRRGRRRRGR